MPFRRRPSLNKQLRKKLESMMTSSKVQFDASTIERIRQFATRAPIDAANLTVKVSYSKKHRNFNFRLKIAVRGTKTMLFYMTTICIFGRMKRPKIVLFTQLPRQISSSTQVKTTSLACSMKEGFRFCNQPRTFLFFLLFYADSLTLSKA